MSAVAPGWRRLHPLSPAIREEFMRRGPSATVVEGDGCTETAGLIRRKDDPVDRRRALFVLSPKGKRVDGPRIGAVGI